jgi:hypothetical protein
MTAKEEPKRATLLRDTDEAKCAKSHTARVAPRRAKLRRDREDARVVKSRTDS